VVDGDGVVPKTEDTVESAKSKGKTWLVGGFAEVLVLNFEVANAKEIVGDVTRNFT